MGCFGSASSKQADSNSTDDSKSQKRRSDAITKQLQKDKQVRFWEKLVFVYQKWYKLNHLVHREVENLSLVIKTKCCSKKIQLLHQWWQFISDVFRRKNHIKELLQDEVFLKLRNLSQHRDVLMPIKFIIATTMQTLQQQKTHSSHNNGQFCCKNVTLFKHTKSLLEKPHFRSIFLRVFSTKTIDGFAIHAMFLSQSKKSCITFLRNQNHEIILQKLFPPIYASHPQITFNTCYFLFY